MPGAPLLEAEAIIDIQDRASAKLDAISKKFDTISKTIIAAAGKAVAFDKLDKNLSKISVGTDKATKALAGLDKQLSSVGRSSSTAGTAAAGFDRIAHSATTAEQAVARYARAQQHATTAMARAAKAPRPVMSPTPSPRRPAPAGYRYDRWGRLIEADVGARVAESGLTRAAKAGAELEKQRVDATAAGLSPAEATETEDVSLALSRKYPTVGQSALMRMIRNARAATGDLEDALAVMDPLTKLRVLAQAKNPGADVSAEFETFVKGLEIKGVAQDPAEFTKYMDGMAKALNIFGEQVTPSSYYQMFKYGRGSTRGLSEDYMLGVAPTLAAELGGSSAGVGGQAFYQAIIGRRLKASALKELEALGLLDESKVERDKKGQPKHIGVGGVVGADLARSDPYKWVNQVLLPAMAKKGITDPSAISDHITAIFSNSLAQQLVGILATQQKRIEKDRNNLGNAQGLVAADEYLARDPGQALGAFTTQLENLLANASSPLMPAATAALRGLADALGSLAETAKQHPVAAPAGLAAGLGGIALGGVWLTRKILSFLGFGVGAGGAAAETGAAVAGGAVAGGGAGAALGRVLRFARGASLPALAAAAVVSAIVGGYEAADDTSRAHPYGKPGDAWDRLRRDALKAADEKHEKDRQESEQRRQWFEDKRRRERGEAVDGLAPTAAPMPSLTGLAPAAGPAAGPGAAPFALGNLVPGSGAGGDAVATVIGDRLDQSATKIAEALNGHAEVQIKIEASPELIAKIERIAKDATLKAVNLTGPGSLGQNGTNIDQHR
jgi:hypothetical protein